MRLIATLLLLASLGRSENGIDAFVDQLFDSSAPRRAAARKALLARGDAVLGHVLDRIEARQKDAEVVLHLYAAQDLATEKVVWAMVRDRLGDVDADIKEQREGILAIRATRAVHKDVAAILDRLRERLGHVVTISSAIVQLGEGIAVPKGFGPGAFDRWVRANRVVVKPLPTLTCRYGERVEVTAMRKVSYVADFDVEIANGTYIADPVVETLPKGLSLHVRALAEDDVTLYIDVASAALEQPIKATMLPLPAGAPVQIQTPEARSIRIRTFRTIPFGASTVVDLGEGKIVVVGAEARKLKK